MNPLETRIYRDVTSAAAEITPADIPPLRLRAQRGRPPWQRGTAGARSAFTGMPGSPRARRWLTPLGAAASIVALVAVMVAVGSATNAGHRITGPTAPAAGRGQALLGTEALDYYFPATGAQYTAGLAFEWTQQKTLNQLVEPCLAHAGFPQPAFSLPKRQYMLSFPSNSQFPDLAQQTRLMTSAGQGPGPGQDGIEGSKNQSRAYHAAVRRCTASDAKPVTRVDQAAGPLANAWLPIIARIQSSARILALQPAFRSCLEARGIPAAYAQSRGGHFLFEGFIGWMDHLAMTDLSAPQRIGTERSIARERRWTPVFVHCARPTVTVMERLQLAQRARFFRQHARQISIIKTLAMDLPSASRR